MRKAADKRRLERWGNPRVNWCSGGEICIKFLDNSLPPLTNITMDERRRFYINGIRIPPLFRKHERHWQHKEKAERKELARLKAKYG